MAVEATTTPTPTELRNVDAALARHGDFAQLWIDGMRRGDPLADAVVADGASLVRRAIAHGIDSLDDPPAAIVELFAELDATPPWLDLDACDRAGVHLARHHRCYGLVLGAASLLAGAQSTVAGKPLTFTGRYATDAAVRSIEVGSWLLAVATPGGLRRHGEGFEHTVRVRMIHANVRAGLSAHPDWNADAWGLPIPQPFMAFTLAEFCSVALRAMHQLGVRYSEDELDDIRHLWRYVGHLVGVAEDFLPVTADDYARIESLYALTALGPDDDDREFVAALSAFQAAELARVVPAALSEPIINGLQRAFLGDVQADALAIPDNAWKRLPPLLSRVNRAGTAAHDACLSNGRARRSARGLRVRRREFDELRARYAVAHELVDDAG
ncbi:MAG TPA: oxygenase MpaB family protein [Solirubrobacteraceae bacterium]|jgi:hypothetical protein|nr:oxygenase MpaB family protein [Solirubrobacteraceae bacterium]